MSDLRHQLQRNLLAMAMELARDPGADQREWDAMAGEVFGCSVARIVTVSLASDNSGHGASCDKTELGQVEGKDCHSAVTRNVTLGAGGTRNRIN